MQLQSVTSENERKAMKSEFQCAMRSLAMTSDTAIIKRPLIVIGAYSSKNEELLASKEEVRSLKKTLADLNTQIRELLKQQARNRGICRARGITPRGDELFLPLGKREAFTPCECHRGGSPNASALIAGRRSAANSVAALTPRQREVLELVLAGHPSKKIAAHLSISQRTVENHRASIMKKTGSRSLPALTRFALFAEGANGLLFQGEILVEGSPPSVRR